MLKIDNGEIVFKQMRVADQCKTLIVADVDRFNLYTI